MRNILALLVLSLVLGGCSCGTIEPGTVGVAVDMGKVDEHVMHEGFYTNSITTDVHEMSVQLQTLDEQDVPCRSKDNVTITADVTVQFALNAEAAPKVYRNVGEEYPQRIIVPAVRSAVRDAVAEFEALVVAQSRNDLETRIKTAVRSAVSDTLKNHNMPENAINIDNVQLRNVDLPQSLTASIETIQRQANQARERQQAIQTAQQEAERLRIETEGRNRVAVMQATNDAEVRRIRAESEAAYYRQLGAAMTPQLVELQRIQMQGNILANQHTRLVILGSGGQNGSPVVLNPTAFSQ